MANPYSFWSGSPGAATKGIQGWNRVKNSFRKIVRANQTYFRKVNQGWARYVVHQLAVKPYPPEMVGQQYKRTYRLAGGFRYQTAGDAVQFYNEASNLETGFVYPGVVILEGSQIWPHRGRWWTIDQVVEDHMDDLRRRLYEAIERDFVQ